MNPVPDWMRAEYPFEPQYLGLTSGSRMSYLDEGEGSAVVMLHGNPTLSYFYRHLVKALSSTMRCIVPDHIGCGFSDKPQDYSYRLEQHVSNAVELIESLDLERFDLVLHDWGGAIGMGVARELKEKVDRLVVTNTAAFRSKSIPWQINICRTPFLGSWIIRGLNGFAGPATKMAVSERLPEVVKRGFLYPYQNWNDRIANWAFVQDIPMRAVHPSWDTLVDIEKGLESFKNHPMLLLWGMKDFCFHPGFLEEWERRFPDAKVQRISDAGHYLYEDATEQTVGKVAEFLAR